MAYSWDNRVDFVVRYMYGKLSIAVETPLPHICCSFKTQQALSANWIKCDQSASFNV